MKYIMLCKKVRDISLLVLLHLLIHQYWTPAGLLHNPLLYVSSLTGLIQAHALECGLYLKISTCVSSPDLFLELQTHTQLLTQYFCFGVCKAFQKQA